MSAEPPDPPPPEKPVPSSVHIGLAYELIGFLVAPPLIGYFLDTKVFEFAGGRPGLFLFLGLFLGFFGAGWFIYRRFIRNGGVTAPVVASGRVKRSIKEESVENKVDRISRELDEVSRRIDGAVSSNRRSGSANDPEAAKEDSTHD